MKQYLLLSAFALLFFTAQSQEIERQVIANATHFFESGSLSLNGTVGEPTINTLEEASLSLGQGFHQGSLTITSTYQPFEDLKFQVYPNPTADRILISTSAEKPLHATIFDLTGSVLKEQALTYPIDQTAMHLGHFPSGHYFLKITDEKGLLIFSSSIQKINQ